MIKVESKETAGRCAMYVRTRRHLKKDALDQEVSERLAEAQKQGWQADSKYVFTDAGFDGQNYVEHRPGLTALLKTAREQPRPFDFVVVEDLMMFSRKVADILTIYSELSRAGVRVAVLHQPTARDRKSRRTARNRKKERTPFEPSTLAT